MSDVTVTGSVPIQRLTKDLAAATATMSDDEARFLVDAYYLMQENRKRSDNQVRSMSAEPHTVIAWLANQSDVLETQIKRALDKYTDAKPIGRWLKSIYGIGPVIAAGLIAHIDINKAPAAGNIWSFAGLSPNKKWEKGQKRPYNAGLKTLCWKIGQVFMKFSKRDECFYGKLYRERKEWEIASNERGENREVALELAKKFRPTTESYKYYMQGKLPPAQIDARARRFAVKIFLSHLQQVWWELEKGTPAVEPYAIKHLGHVHVIAPPSIPEELIARRAENQPPRSV